jgi:hypothetical protein
MNLILPQELTDWIIDYLHDDIETLSVCSLVCSSWLPASRYHKFSSITIPNPWSFATCPAAAPLVRKLTIYLPVFPVVPAQYKDWNMTDVSMCTNVETLRLSNVRLDGWLLEAMQSGFPFPKLTTLILDDCRFETPSDFILLLALFPKLIHFTSYNNGTMQILHSNYAEHLDVSKYLPFWNLRSIAIDLWVSNIPSLNKMLYQRGPTLETLTIFKIHGGSHTFYPIACFNCLLWFVDPFLYPSWQYLNEIIDLSHNNKLHNLSLPKTPLSSFKILSTITSSLLKRLSISFLSFNEFQDSEWEVLDECLLGPQFHGLEFVEFFHLDQKTSEVRTGNNLPIVIYDGLSLLLARGDVGLGPRVFYCTHLLIFNP